MIMKAAPPGDPLSAIRSEGAALSGEFIPASESPPQPDPNAEEKEAREWSEFPALFGAIICQAMPELRDAYSEANCMEWGRRLVPIARRYGWTTSAFGGWVGLLSATWVFAKPTFDAVRARRAASPKAPDAATETKTSDAPAT